MDLQEMRNTIDAIDDEIIALYIRRMETAAQVGAWKREHGVQVLDAGREQALLRRVGEKAGPRYAEGVQALFTLLMAQSRALQEKDAAEADRTGEKKDATGGKRE